MVKNIEILKANRAAVLALIKPVSTADLNKIPQGFSNSIIWNVAHLVVTQQILCYTLSGLPTLVPDALIEEFRKGTKPNRTIEAEEINTIKELFEQLPIQLEKDFNAKIFTQYNTYTTSAGICLRSIEDAILYNTYHEGLHRGTITSLTKAI